MYYFLITGSYRYIYDRSKLATNPVRNGWKPQSGINSQNNTGNQEKSSNEKSKDYHETRTTSLSTSTGRRGSLQLWQFLVALLDAPDASAGCIAWTGRGMEFKLIEPEEVHAYIGY